MEELEDSASPVDGLANDGAIDGATFAVWIPTEARVLNAVVVASRVLCARRGGGPISCCGMKAQSVIRSRNLLGEVRDGYRVHPR